MITWFKISVAILFVVLSYASVGAAKVFAQEVSAENLRLEGTFIKTESTGLFLSSTLPAQGFTQTTVNCPRRRTCTIRVELSTGFSNIQAPNVAATALLVDGLQAGVQPYAVLGLDSTSIGAGSNVRTFSWMKTGLAHGQHTIDVFFFTDSGGIAWVLGRILTVQIYSSFSDHEHEEK